MPDKIRVTAIQRLCVNDGPGVRTVVFLKGCYLQCPWCCNPEAIHYDGDEYFEKGTCCYPNVKAYCKDCSLHQGMRQRDDCPVGAFERTYSDYTAEELFSLIMRDEELYRNGGGVTFSGGEPLLQAKVLAELLSQLKEHGIHVALETTLYAPVEHYQGVRDFVDYWLVDLKFQYDYIVNHDNSVDPVAFESNLLDLQSSGQSIVYRMVVMAEIQDRKAQIVSRLMEHSVSMIELLPCHGLAENKYKELGKSFHRFKASSKSDMAEFAAVLNVSGVSATMLTL